MSGVYLFETKTKGDIDELQVQRQLKYDLQTMLYLIALERLWTKEHPKSPSEIKGVRYNVVRRPLSGGVGNITKHKGKTTKEVLSKKDGRVLHPSKVTLAETDAEFYERLRADYIAADPAYWFFRVRSEVSAEDVRTFKETCLDPVLEQLCWWYDEVTGVDMTNVVHDFGFPPTNHRMPFGVYAPLLDGGSTEYDGYLETGSEAGLRRTDKLFTELEDATDAAI